MKNTALIQIPMLNSHFRYAHMATPLGNLWIAESDAGIAEVGFREGISPGQKSDLLTRARRQLDAYFEGRLTCFDLPLAPQGTAFQQSVWRALCAIDYGITASYSQIAHAIHKPKAVRAVGAANGRNPLAIIVPCHRIIGANGNLTGYNGGLERKQWLLKHEASGRS